MNALTSPRLERLADRRPDAVRRPAGVEAPKQPERQTCELCAQPIAPEHRHVLDLEKRTILCACRACTILFDRDAAGGGHFRLIPDRAYRLASFRLDGSGWAALEIPVDMAFFVRQSGDGRVAAFYPGAAGATESQLPLQRWSDLEAANPVLRDMEPDVEALLVRRLSGAGDAWLVPVDECYALVGLIRTSWKGLSGGTEVWEKLDAFFARLAREAGVLEANEEREER